MSQETSNFPELASQRRWINQGAMPAMVADGTPLCFPRNSCLLLLRGVWAKVLLHGRTGRTVKPQNRRTVQQNPQATMRCRLQRNSSNRIIYPASGSVGQAGFHRASPGFSRLRADVAGAEAIMAVVQCRPQLSVEKWLRRAVAELRTR
jgi:hypothetical protein